MTTGSEAAAEHDAFSDNVIRSIDEIFWQPEIARRGGPEVVGPLTHALAILPPDGPVEVRLNQEAVLAARARPGAPELRGQSLSVDNIEHLETLEPVGIDPNAGWVAMALLPDGRLLVHFDYRRNRGRAERLLALAREFIDTAEAALDRGHLGPCLDTIFSAAELAVTSSMLLTTEDPMRGKGDRHARRRNWIASSADLGNVPELHHTSLLELARLRPAARYGDGDLGERITHDEVRRLLDAVIGMHVHAVARAGLSHLEERTMDS